MAGTIRGTVDCRSNNAGATNNLRNIARDYQEMFTVMFNFLSNHPGVTRIAYNTGNAGVWHATFDFSGTARGIGYWNDAASFGPHAWAVFRFNNALFPYYLFIRFHGQTNTTFANGAVAGNNRANDLFLGFSMQTAFGIAADGVTSANPWLGTTNNNGADTYPTKRWGAPTGGKLVVLPRNSDVYGGNWTTNHNQEALFSNTYDYNLNTTTARRYHILADDDSFLFLYAPQNDRCYGAALVSRYTLNPGFTNPCPYLMHTTSQFTGGNANSAALPLGKWTANGSSQSIGYGNVPGFNPAFDERWDGGVIFPNPRPVPVVVSGLSNQNPRAAALYFDNHYTAVDLRMAPNMLSPTGDRYDEYRPRVIAFDRGGEAVGDIGILDPFVREIFNLDSEDCKSDFTRAYFGGHQAPGTWKLSVPWGGTTPPGSGMTRTGVSFTQVP